ncbi:hypothetical protein V8E55_002650 [Tylopilus felleus]
MLTSTSSRLLRLLLSLITRLRLSVGRIVLALRAGSISFWRSILASARHIGQPRIQLHASNVPVIDNNPIKEDSQRTNAVEEIQDHNRTLAIPPASERISAGCQWQSRLSTLRERTSNCQLKPFSLCFATPEGGSQRYNLSGTDDLFRDSQGTIPAGQQTLLSSLSPLPCGWRRYLHPEGVTLFYHERLRIFTEHDISNPTKEEILLCATKLVEKAIERDSVTLDELTEIVLNLDKDRSCHYYFVDHTHRLLFWVDNVDVKALQIPSRKNSGYNNIKYKVEAYYWSHCEYYPHTCPLPREVFEDLRGTLNYAKIDMITADSSSSPFGQDELVAMLGLLESLKDEKWISDPYSIWAIGISVLLRHEVVLISHEARLKAYFTENQFLNFCGQTCARLNADAPLFRKPDWNRRPLFRAINLFLFGSPNEHAVRLQQVWVDGIIIQPRWKDFVNRLTAELARYTIFSTVMLAVNFSFLALPGVIPQGSAASPIQIIIYCSLVSTIASIVFSFELLNVYSNPRLLNAQNVLTAMETLSGTTTGMAGLAITHSLPIASLVWSIALFSAALAVQIFRPIEPATIATLSVEVLIIALFLVMGMRVMRLFSQDDGGRDEDAPTGNDSHPPGSPQIV